MRKVFEKGNHEKLLIETTQMQLRRVVNQWNLSKNEIKIDYKQTKDQFK